MIILGSHALGTSVLLPDAIKCDRCKSMHLVIVHNPLAPGALCSSCAGTKS